jgi:hypothetical protein
MKMFLSNGNNIPRNAIVPTINTASLSVAPKAVVPKPPTALNAAIISRIHSVKPGCGSCGRGH